MFNPDDAFKLIEQGVDSDDLEGLEVERGGQTMRAGYAYSNGDLALSELLAMLR